MDFPGEVRLLVDGRRFDDVGQLDGDVILGDLAVSDDGGASEQVQTRDVADSPRGSGHHLLGGVLLAPGRDTDHLGHTDHRRALGMFGVRRRWTLLGGTLSLGIGLMPRGVRRMTQDRVAGSSSLALPRRRREP